MLEDVSSREEYGLVFEEHPPEIGRFDLIISQAISSINSHFMKTVLIFRQHRSGRILLISS